MSVSSGKLFRNPRYATPCGKSLVFTPVLAGYRQYVVMSMNGRMIGSRNLWGRE